MPLTTQQVDALKKITSPSVANAIETFKVRPGKRAISPPTSGRSSPSSGPWWATPSTALIRAERGPIEGHRASVFGWWDFVLAIPAPRVIVVHDLDDPRGQGAHWGEVQANIHRALGCVGVVTDGSVRDLPRCARSASSSARPTSRSPTPTSTWWTSASRSRWAASGSSRGTSSTATSTAC